MKSKGVLLLALLVLCGCGLLSEGDDELPRPDTEPSPRDSLFIQWEKVDSLQDRLPEEVQVFQGSDDDPAMRAWYAVIQQPGSMHPVRVEVAGNEDTRREAVSSFADRLGACIVVNGSYFMMNRTPSLSRELLKVEGELLAPATNTVTYGGETYQATRAALGFAAEGQPEITWATSEADTLLSWAEPPSNAQGSPDTLSDNWQMERWSVWEALGAGPMIVRAGDVHVTHDEEAFFVKKIDGRHPRTAAGITEEGDLILMVVDGRQEASIGVTLEELAQLMIEVGAEEALNLDGGGSSTMVVNNVLMNRPQGETAEREVHNAVAVFCSN